jgi:16S rRNA (adenine1518-N6/adenine1519-N6)-dimethyltransferase
METKDSESVPEKRQTLSFLANIFRERGLRPKKKLGQNFLIDLNLLDFVVREAELTPEDLVIEVGSGTGSLTLRLATHAKAVFSVEVDSAFFELASEHVTGRDNVLLVHADILRNKNTLNPKVMAALTEFRKAHPRRRIKLIANLPYAVATPVIANFLLLDWPLERMVVTVQWEMAERLTAQPGSRDYGGLTVLVQSLAEVELLRRLPPTVFWPRPQVASAIVRIRPNPAKRARIPDVHRLRNFLRDLYAHRRKNLRGALLGFPGKPWTKAEVDRRLSELGIQGTLRAEVLGIEEHLRLCETFG